MYDPDRRHDTQFMNNLRRYEIFSCIFFISHVHCVYTRKTGPVVISFVISEI